MSLFTPTWCLCSYFLLFDHSNEKKKQWQQHYLNEKGQKRRDRQYPRTALKYYSESPFKYLYESKDDQALLNACGVDHKEFSKLLSQFEPFYRMYILDENNGIIRKKNTEIKDAKNL